MKYLIAGLGNPGAEYHNTRHNIGFMVLDWMAGYENFAPARYGLYAEYKHKGRAYVLVKPDTYMNLSGKAVQYYLNALKLETDSLMVITDDIALEFGAVRIRAKGSDGGHNGLKNINDVLGTTAYPRMRVGVGSDFPKGRQVDYVLSSFEDEEFDVLDVVLKHCAEAVKQFGFIGLQRTMSQYNKKLPLPEKNDKNAETDAADSAPDASDD